MIISKNLTTITRTPRVHVLVIGVSSTIERTGLDVCVSENKKRMKSDPLPSEMLDIYSYQWLLEWEASNESCYACVCCHDV